MINKQSEVNECLKIENTKDEIILIVDENDIEVGPATRKEMREKNLLHRSSQVFIYNKMNKKYTIQKRSKNKEYFPGYYEIGCGGCLDYGENIDICAVRELKEELGLNIEKLNFIGKNFHKDNFSSGFTYIYYCEYEEDKYSFSDGEVESIDFWTEEEIIIKKEEITPDCFKAFQFYLANKI